MGVASADGVAMEGGGGRGCCCGPQAFTSGVLGALACLLVTGGVFLAFHRWDPLWLVVSAVGALLALVGSLLHCCAEQQGRPAPVHKGGASAPLHHQQGPAMLPEQLVPLSNARSVSQLSLNMLPGYFPPVVAAYGIEQHSAVVQNIVGHQQQQQRGARLLVLSLPDHTPQASLHSLVAAVYQLDGNVLTEIPSMPENNTAPPAVPPVVLQPPQPVFKHVEVQTTTAWPASPSQPSTSLNLLDCSAPICDTLPPTDQVLVPLRQEALVSTRAPPDTQPEVHPSNTRVSSEVSRSSVSTETQVSHVSSMSTSTQMSPTSSVSTNTQVLPTSSVSTSTQVIPKSSRSSFSRRGSDGKRSSAGTRRSTRAEARRPSAPADIQAPSTSSTSNSEPVATEEQIPTRSDNQTSTTTVAPRRVTDAATSQDSHSASRSSDVPSYSSAMCDEMPSTDAQRVSNTNAQESARTSNAPERSGAHTETPTAVQTSPRQPEVPDCSIRMPEVPASQRNESSVTVSIPQEVEVQVPSDVQVVSSGPDASQDNVTPIHCQTPTDNVLVEISSDNNTPSASNTSSSSSVLIDITESEAIPSTSAGLMNSERLLDESLLGAVGGASSELSLSDLDEAELMERSSPPPSYDDVTHERNGSFALAYGTM